MQNLFTYPIHLDDLSATEKKYKINANKEQCKEVAEILQVEDVHSLKAEIRLQYNKKSGIADVSGHVEAEMAQMSVISLEKFDKSYQSDFSETYTTQENEKVSEGREVELDWREDAPEPVKGGVLDLADVVIEQLALVMDYNPRQEGEVFEFVSEFDEETTKAQNPFSVLQKIAK